MSSYMGEIWYTVYDARTDELLVCGSSDDCARYFGVSRNGFHTLVSHVKTGRNRGYCVVLEDLTHKTYTVYGKDNTGNRVNAMDQMQARRLWAEGMSDQQIAEQIGCSNSTVHNWRVRNRLKSNGKPGRPRKEAK